MLVEIKCGCCVLDTIEVPDNAIDVDIWEAVIEEVENNWIDWEKVDEDGCEIEE